MIIACNAAPARCSVASDGGGSSFSKRSQHLDGQLLQAPVTLSRFTTTLRTPRMLPGLAACLNVCLPIPASLIDRDPQSLRLFRLAERSSPQMQLEWRTSTRLRESMPHRLEPDSP